MIRSACQSVVRSLALPLLLSLFAAPAASAAKVRLLAFQRVGSEMEVNITDADGKLLSKAPVTLPTQQLSPTTEIPGPALVFTAPKDPAKILGKVTLPAGGDEFVLIFLPAGAAGAEPYKIDAVSLPASEFRPGDYAFINYSGSAVGCDIEGEKLAVAHGKCAVYRADKSGKKIGNRSMVCYRQKDGAWESTPFLSSRIIVQDGVRNLVFICLDPRSGAVDFRGIADYPER